MSKGRFNLDEDAREIYLINWKRVLVYDMDTGAFKRGWGGHGMPLSEISNDPIPPYKWTGAPPPDEKNFVPDLHFAEISKDGLVYVGERGQDRIEVFTKDGNFVKEFYVSPNTPSRGEDCGGLPPNTKMPPCGTTYKMVFSKDPEQKYMYVADGTNITLDSRSQDRQNAWLLRQQRQIRRPVPLDQCDRDGFARKHLHGRSGAGQTHSEVRSRVGHRSLKQRIQVRTVFLTAMRKAIRIVIYPRFRTEEVQSQ